MTLEELSEMASLRWLYIGGPYHGIFWKMGPSDETAHLEHLFVGRQSTTPEDQYYDVVDVGTLKTDVMIHNSMDMSAAELAILSMVDQT